MDSQNTGAVATAGSPGLRGGGSPALRRSRAASRWVACREDGWAARIAGVGSPAPRDRGPSAAGGRAVAAAVGPTVRCTLPVVLGVIIWLLKSMMDLKNCQSY